MGNRLKDRAAIVTGAGRGIGRCEALALADEGAAVVVNDFGGSTSGQGSDKAPADEVVEQILAAGGRAAANYGNITLFQTGEELVKQAFNTFGRLDIVVNNAGILRDRMVFNMTEEEWDAVIAVHLTGHFNLTRAACVLFKTQRSGAIVNTSSTSGLGNIGQANYAAAKEGIVGFTRTVARDMGKYGVRCNAIRPTAGTRMTVSDEMMEAAKRGPEGDQAAERMREFAESNPPEAIAPLVVWLCTDEAAHVNGRTFGVRADEICLYSEPEPIARITPDGAWTLDDVAARVPAVVTKGLVNAFLPQEAPAG